MSNTPLVNQISASGSEPGPSNGRVRSLESHNSILRPIRLSAPRDGGLLKVVRNATFISRRQVHVLAFKFDIESNHKTIDWRLNRLAEVGLLDKVRAIYPFCSDLFSITRSGLQVLEFWDQGLASITSESENLADLIQAPHFLALNDLRISLHSNPDCNVITWLSDREISSMNYNLTRPYAKDYDAIVQFTFKGGHETRLGIEYERTFKSEDRYRGIAKELDAEKGLTAVLYLTAAKDMIFRLLPLITCELMPVCFASGAAFRDTTFNTTVAFMHSGKPAQATFAEFLHLADAIKSKRPR